MVTGYLPSAVLKGFIYIVPFAMLGMAKLGGSISKSKEEIKACNMVFYFLLGNVFFLSLISGSLLDEIGEYVSHPKNLPSHLASLVSSQASSLFLRLLMFPYYSYICSSTSLFFLNYSCLTLISNAEYEYIYSKGIFVHGYKNTIFQIRGKTYKNSKICLI